MFANLVKMNHIVKRRQIFATFIRPISVESSNSNRQIPQMKSNVFSVEINSVSDEVRQQFNSVFPAIVEDLSSVVKDKPSLVEWYTRMLEYNVPNGRKRRGFSVILTYKLLEKELTPEKMRLANIVGWCAELQTAAILVADDIMDRAETRRTLPCWYKVKDIGLSAVMDATILEDSAYVLLQKHLRDHPSYITLVEFFHAMFLKICIGQAVDCRVSCVRKPNLEHICWDNYKTITEYKVEYISYLFPVRAAMYLAGIHDPELHRQADAVFRPPGYLLQVKNDFLDCFGTEDKHGSLLYGDIREGKCAWPAVVTLERASPAQRAIMERCYGRPDDQSVEAVLEVYRDLDMPSLFVNHEKEILNNVDILIEQLDPRLPKEMVYNILGMA